MRTFRLFLGISLFALLFAACEKQEDLQTPATTDTTDYEMLQFEDQNAFDAMMLSFSGKTNIDMLEWSKGKKFISAQSEYYRALDEIDQVQTMEQFQVFKKKWDGRVIFREDAIFDPLFPGIKGWLVNPKGLVKVGKDLNWFQADRLIRIKNADKWEDAYQAFAELPVGTSNEILDVVSFSNISRLQTNGVQLRDENIFTYSAISSNRRQRAEILIRDSGGNLTETWIKQESQFKGTFGWRLETAQSLSQFYNNTVIETNQGIPVITISSPPLAALNTKKWESYWAGTRPTNTFTSLSLTSSVDFNRDGNPVWDCSLP